jgi:hypothetical protein
VSKRTGGPRKVPIEVQVKRERAVELRLAGATYHQIAKELGYNSHTSAMRAVEAAIARRTSESAALIKAQELARLDQMLLGLWPAARRGDALAVDRVLRVMDRRARYLGLDVDKGAATTEVEGSPLDDLAARRAARRSTTAP